MTARVRTRTLGMAIVAVLTTVLLSGCLSLDLTTTVSAQGAFTGEMKISYDKKSLKEAGVGSLADVQRQMGTPATASTNVTTAWAETDEDYVQTVSFVGATPKEIESATTTGSSENGSGLGLDSGTTMSFPLSATVQGDKMVVGLSDSAKEIGEKVPGAAATDAPADANAGLDEAATKLIERLFGDSTVKLVITMPGAIESVTGAIPKAGSEYPGIAVGQPDSDTVEMTAGFVDMARLSEEAGDQDGLTITSAITSEPVAGSPSTAAPGSGERNPTLLLGGLAVLAAVIVAVAVVVLRSRGSRAGDGDNAA